MLEPRKPEKRNGIILEFKIYDKEEEKGLRDTVAAALKQVEEKGYKAVLLDKGLPEERIYIYGMAFRGKEVLIQKA